MIEVQNLSKSVEGNVIFADLTFRVESGESLALLGANGSGKSLLLTILATLTEPTSGTVNIAGHDAFTNLREVRPLIGYVPETFDGYPHLSIVEYLGFFAAAYKLDKSGRATAIEDVLNLMDIAAIADRKIASLSQGEKRRLCLANTFLHDPEIWLFDEPFFRIGRAWTERAKYADTRTFRNGKNDCNHHEPTWGGCSHLQSRHNLGGRRLGIFR